MLRDFWHEPALFKIAVGLLAFPLLLPFFYSIGVVIWELTGVQTIHQIFFPIFHKTLLFQLSVELAFIAYLALLIREKKYNPFLTAVHSALILLGVILVITSVLSLDSNTGFFGSTRRGDGVFFLLHVGFFIALLSWLARARRTLELLFAIAIGAGLAFLVFIGIAVFVEFPTAPFARDSWNQIIIGSLGNLNFSAHYFLFLLMFGGYFALKKRTLFNLVIPAVFLFFIFVSSSNTAIILGGIVYMGLLWMYSRWLVYGVIAAGTSAAWYSVLTNSALFDRWGALGDSFIIRWYIWKDAVVTLVAHNFWLGYGWGNGELMWNYAPADTPAMFYNLSSHFLADRMHNIVIEMFSAAGVIGVTALFFFFGTLLLRCVRELRRERNALTLFFPAVFIVQLFYLLFNFDTLMSYILIGITFGGYLGINAAGTRQLFISQHVQKIVVFIAVLVLAPVIYFLNFVPFHAFFLKMRADEKIVKAESYVNPKTGEIIELLNRVASIKQPYRSLLREVATSFYTLSDAVSFSSEERVRVSQSLTSIYETFLKKSPATANAYHNLALIELKYFNNLRGTEEYLKKAIALAPYNGLIRFQLGMIYFKMDDRRAAKEVFTQLSTDGIYDGSVNFYLGLIDFNEGRTKEGKGQIITALASFQPKDPQWNEHSDAFLTHGSKKELLAWYQTIIRISDAPSQYLYAKTIRLAKELGRTDLVARYSKEVQGGFR